MEKFTIRLNSVKDAYYGFTVAVLTYINNKPARLIVVEKYLDENPNAAASDVLEFISNQDDFYEDSAYAQAEVV